MNIYFLRSYENMTLYEFTVRKICNLNLVKIIGIIAFISFKVRLVLNWNFPSSKLVASYLNILNRGKLKLLQDIEEENFD